MNDFYDKSLVPDAFKPDWNYWRSQSVAYAIDLAELTVDIQPKILFSKKNKKKRSDLTVLLKYRKPEELHLNLEEIKTKVTTLNQLIISDIKKGELKGEYHFKNNLREVKIVDYLLWLNKNKIKHSKLFREYFSTYPNGRNKTRLNTEDKLEYNQPIVLALSQIIFENSICYTKDDLIKVLFENCNFLTISEDEVDTVLDLSNINKTIQEKSLVNESSLENHQQVIAALFDILTKHQIIKNQQEGLFASEITKKFDFIYFSDSTIKKIFANSKKYLRPK